MITKKIKRPFAERWARVFSKHFDGIVATLSAYFVRKERYVEDVNAMFDHILSIAKTLKVTPARFGKQLAKQEDHQEYYFKLLEAMDKEQKKEAERVANAEAKAKTKTEKAAKKKAK